MMGLRVPFPPPRDDDECREQIAALEKRIMRTRILLLAIWLAFAVATVAGILFLR